jgi:toxin ParE1/3/4
MQLRISPLAAEDLEAIGDFIAKDNPLRALSFIRELRAHCEKILRNPSAYRRRPELSEHLQSCAHGNYLIFFECQLDSVNIVRILHGSRDIEPIIEPT